MGRVASSSGRMVSGAAAKRTVIKQFNVVANHYRSARGLRAVLPSGEEFRAAVQAVRNPALLRVSYAEQTAALAGRLDPAIARAAPHVARLGDIAPKATRLTRVSVGVDAAKVAADVARQAKDEVTPEEQAQQRAAEVDPIPVHP